MLWSKCVGRSSVPVLCYHNIDGNGMPWAAFTRQMLWLKAHGIRTISLDRLERFLNGEALSAPSVCVTFDDGFRDLYTRVAPFFREHDLHATVFIINNRIRPEDESGTDEPITAHEAHREFLVSGARGAWMSESEIRSIMADGTFAIGSHSTTHVMGAMPPWQKPEKPDHWAYARWHAGLEQGEPPRMVPEFTTHLYLPDKERLETDDEFFARVQDNLSASRGDLEKRFGVQVTTLGWPWGAAHPIAVEAAQAAGFRLLFTLENGPVTPGTSPAHICRLEVRRKKGPSWFKSRVAIYSRKTIAALYAWMRI